MTFFIIYFQKQHKCHIFSSFEIRFALKGINTLYYRETGKYFATLVVIKLFGFRFMKKPSIPERNRVLS